MAAPERDRLAEGIRCGTRDPPREGCALTVVDASVATLWFLKESRSTAAREYLTPGAVLTAPDLLLCEVGNALWRGLRATGDHAAWQRAAEFLRRLPRRVKIVSSSGLIPAALDIARALDHPVYDALYVALAQECSATLATLDERLAKKLASSAYASVLGE